MESPRFTKTSAAGCEVSIEGRVPPAAIKQLQQQGHSVGVRREYTQEMGRGQVVLHNSKSGTNYAASDPRGDGLAIPELITGEK
jgi:gamma-glutamyltranspeptidase/glutathione hydrolase